MELCSTRSTPTNTPSGMDINTGSHTVGSGLLCMNIESAGSGTNNGSDLSWADIGASLLVRLSWSWLWVCGGLWYWVLNGLRHWLWVCGGRVEVLAGFWFWVSGVCGQSHWQRVETFKAMDNGFLPSKILQIWQRQRAILICSHPEK